MGGGIRLASVLLVLNQMGFAVLCIRTFGSHLHLSAHHNRFLNIVRIVRGHTLLGRDVGLGVSRHQQVLFVLIKYGATVIMGGLFWNLCRRSLGVLLGLQGVRVAVAGLKRVIKKLFNDQRTFIRRLLRIRRESLVDDLRLVARLECVSLSGISHVIQEDFHVGAYCGLHFALDLIAGTGRRPLPLLEGRLLAFVHRGSNIPDVLHLLSRILIPLVNHNFRLHEVTFEVQDFYGAVFELLDD